MPNGTRSIAVSPDVADTLAIRAKQQQRLEGRAISMREVAEVGITWVLTVLAQAEAAGQPLTLQDVSARIAALGSATPGTPAADHR